MSTIASSVAAKTSQAQSQSYTARRAAVENRTGWLFAMPHLLLFSLFMLAPTLFGFYISLHHWQVLDKTHPFIGMSNYSAAFSDDIFWLALRNTIYFVILVVPAGNLVSLLLALGLTKVRAFATFYKVAFYLPVVISIAVVAVLWIWIYNTEIGLLNLYIGSIVDGVRHIGIPLPPFQPLPWLSDPKWAMPSIAMLSIWWGAGGNMILYLAGINNIAPDYYEAASIDGAGQWHQFWGITWPLLRPTTLFCMVFSVLGAFQIFGQSYVIYGGGSGPGRAGLTMVLYMFQQGFDEFEIGYGTAIAYILFAIVLILTFVQFKLLAPKTGGLK